MQPEADRPTLIRRAYFDLIGLPPTPAEVQAFVDDKSPNAWEKVIDRLLASPHYGEQWGRHWLDVAGYSDSRGDAGDSDREVSWKYRDYVIHAFNRNKPINQFILEQLAGDQLVNYKHLAIPTPDQIEPLTATGFMRTTADITDNQTIYEVDKYFDAQQKAMETSLTALLGVTVQCARCHDHKFDPILQRDYYKLMAVYQPVWDPENWLPADLNHGPWPSRMVLDMDEGSRARVDQGRHQQRRQGHPPHGRSAGSDLPEIPRRAEGRPRHLRRSQAPADAQGHRERSRPGSRPQRPQGRHHRPGDGEALPGTGQMEGRDPGEAVRAPQPVQGPAELHRGVLGYFEDAVAHLHSGARQLSRSGRRSAARTSAGPRQSAASAGIPRRRQASGMERHQPPPDPGASGWSRRTIRWCRACS